MRYLVSTGTSNHNLKRIANAQARRAITEHTRKSAVAKRMDRPAKLEKASRGHDKIYSILDRFKV